MFMCRWPNGDLIVRPRAEQGRGHHRAGRMGQFELAEITRVSNFMVDFRLNAERDLKLQAIGEALQDYIWEKAFPLLAEARGAALADGDEPTNAGKEVIRKAVQKEKQRLAGKRRLKTADTELGKSIQRQTGAPAALVNRYVKRRATQLLEHSPTTGHNQ